MFLKKIGFQLKLSKNQINIYEFNKYYELSINLIL